MLNHKLQKVKEYLEKNLKKEVHYCQQSLFCFVNIICQKER